VTHNRTLTRLARGLASGALALTVLGWGGGALPASAPRPALADDMDCYNDADVYDSPECVQQRADDAANGAQPAGDQGQPQTSDTPSQQQAQQPAPDPTQAPAASSTNPKDVVLRLEDAGKQAFTVDTSDGSDKYGRWAHSRFERDRSDGASTLGPNVMDTKAWVAKDLDTAKALYAEQAAIKNFPERKEATTGPVEKVKPTLFGEDASYTAMYYQDGDNKIWQHYRFVMRQGTTVAVVYLFGKEAFFVEPKNKNTWNMQGDWFTSKVFERM
jgi:hypothetical protein